ncbi:MAG: hypothetical protein M0R80_11015 [Proteobacteria bacterium]|jgi:hypothetical protein|nr:hypothetical protein [Pseudomonadota bacterium]
MTNSIGPQAHNGRVFLDPAHSITGLPARTVGDFWQWAYSDVLSNRNRSIFAEYLVGVALESVESPRVEWDSVDLRYRDAKIEVKSAADGPISNGDPAKLHFSIRKSTSMEPAEGEAGGEAARFVDVYVFCHYLEHAEERTDPLDAAAWDFYVVSTKTLNAKFGEAKSIALGSLQRLAKACKFDALRARVDAAVTRMD